MIEKNIIEKLNKACELIDRAEAAGVKANVRVDVGGLSVEVYSPLDGRYYLSGFYMPEAEEAGEDDLP